MVFHRFAYSTAIRDGESPRPFRTRDGAAFCELAAILTAMDWEYGSLIYNYPNSCMAPPRELVGMPSPGRGECLVLTTRPPIDDCQHGDRRMVPWSNSGLEKAIFADLKPGLFSVCARSHVRISDVVSGPSLEEGDFVFRETKDGRLISVCNLDFGKRRHTFPDVDYRTIGFFIKKPEVTGYRCGLIASFGMGGIETLIWNRLVRERYYSWLSEASCFIVAELNLGPACVPDPKDRNRLVLPDGLVTLEFVEKIAVREILHTSI